MKKGKIGLRTIWIPIHKMKTTFNDARWYIIGGEFEMLSVV